MIFNIKHTVNWGIIGKRKQDLIDKNNILENAKRLKPIYSVGDKVLIKQGTENKYEAPYKGPYDILKVNDNGTVRIMRQYNWQ